MFQLRSIVVFVIAPLFLLGSANAYRPYAGTGDIGFNTGLLPRGTGGNHGHIGSQSILVGNTVTYHQNDKPRRVKENQDAHALAANINGWGRYENEKASIKAEDLAATYENRGRFGVHQMQQAKIFAYNAQIHDGLATKHALAVMNPKDSDGDTRNAYKMAGHALHSYNYAASASKPRRR